MDIIENAWVYDRVYDWVYNMRKLVESVCSFFCVYVYRARVIYMYLLIKT
jgi:hypothetical protein